MMSDASVSKTFWLVRHGPTHAKSFVGWTDLPADLSDTAALARMNAALPDVPVISSTLDRAVKTADAFQGTRTRMRHDPRLRETHFGAWENLTWAQIEARDGELTRAVFETPGDTAPPGGESWHDFSARVHAGLNDLHTDTIVVAHMGVILSALQRALGCSAYDAMSHTIDHLSVTTLTYTPHSFNAAEPKTLQQEASHPQTDGKWSVHSINQKL